MKYKALKQKNISLKRVSASNLSLDMSKMSTDVGDNCLTKVKNMILKDGRLVTRNGLFTAESGLLDVSMCDGAIKYNYFLTETVTAIEGEQRRIAYAKVEYDDRNHFILVFGIGENEDVRALGYMIFGRADDTAFYSPENAVFYTGKAQKGGGIFALVSLKNVFNSSDREYHIYEIGADYGSWNRSVIDYVPTVYINGTGTSYGESNLKFSNKPKMLEPRNLLNGDFYAYFSADGFSSGFRLPFTNIDNSPVICRVYQNSQDYVEWRIESNSQIAGQDFMGKRIIANIDRASGTFFFTSGSYHYAIPVMDAYRENNIRIFATKNVENGFENIVSSKIVTDYKNKWLFAGGRESNKIYYMNYDTPLYFPDISSNQIGISGGDVTAMTAFSDRIIASTVKGIYEIGVKNGGNFNAMAILGDNGKIFKEPDSFTARKLSDNSIRNNTLAVCGERLLWLGKDNTVYSLAKSGNGIEEISDGIAPILRQIKSSFECCAVGSEENYILSYGNSAVIINHKDRNCFYWEFPKELKIIGIICYGNDFSFLYQYNGSNECYVAGLSGDRDILFKGRGYRLEIAELPCESEFSLKCFDFGSMQKKTVKRLDLRLATKGKSTVTVGDRNIYARFNLLETQNQDIFDFVTTFITDLSGMRYVELSVTSDQGINFGGADIYFC